MIYVVILNWNGSSDTLACLQSLYGTKGVDYRVIVCDNNSTDGSPDNIQAWAEGLAQAELPCSERLRPLLNTTRSGGFRSFQRMQLQEEINSTREKASVPRLTLIQNGGNLGFAAGNNSGLRYALAQPDMTHVWLLNNDTLVEHDCLLRMLKRLEMEPLPAICGSRVMFYDDPRIIQALGGNTFNRWTGIAGQSIGRYQAESCPRDTSAVEAQLDYISGCSMLLPRSFLEDIGLMSERYFLYYEEVDWIVRASGRYKLVYADDAVIYHKEGSAIGSASFNTGPSLLSDFYSVRSRLRFTLRHFPWAFPSCYLASLLQVLNRWRRGYWASGWLMLKVLFGKRQFHVRT